MSGKYRFMLWLPDRDMISLRYGDMNGDGKADRANSENPC